MGTSLAVWWLGVYFAMQETWVRTLVRKLIPHALEQLGPRQEYWCCNYWRDHATARESISESHLVTSDSLRPHGMCSSVQFSRQEYWSGLPFPSPMHENEKWKQKKKVKVAQCPTLSNPMDCSLPGSSVHGIFWARVLEWIAIAFSGIYLSIPNHTMVHCS